MYQQEIENFLSENGTAEIDIENYKADAGRDDRRGTKNRERDDGLSSYNVPAHKSQQKEASENAGPEGRTLTDDMFFYVSSGHTVYGVDDSRPASKITDGNKNYRVKKVNDQGQGLLQIHAQSIKE